MSQPLHVDPDAPQIDGEPLVRAEQCIAERVDSDISIGMRNNCLVTGNLHPAQNNTVTLGKRVHIVTVPDSRCRHILIFKPL